MKNIYKVFNLFLQILLFLFVTFSYSQDYYEKWNSYLNRYECFDSNNNLVAYRQYNSYSKAWEYYKVNSSNIVRPQSSINQDQIQKTLLYKQKKYDDNKARIQNAINDIYSKFTQSTDDVEVYNKLVKRFENEYFNSIQNKTYDLSSDEITNKLINYLYNGYRKILSESSE